MSGCSGPRPSAGSGALPEGAVRLWRTRPYAWYSDGQVIEAGRRVGMFRAQDLLPDPERFLKERFGFGVLAHIAGTARPGY